MQDLIRERAADVAPLLADPDCFFYVCGLKSMEEGVVLAQDPDDMVRAAQGADRKLITTVNVFDVYEGKGVAQDKKSIALAVTIQPRDKTMTDEEIDALGKKIVAEVIKKTGGTLRG